MSILAISPLISSGKATIPFLSIIYSGEKCVPPTFAMPHRGMASLASVGLDEKPWLSASLAWLNTLPASTVQEKAKG
jgi:hypothetical protein